MNRQTNKQTEKGQSLLELSLVLVFLLILLAGIIDLGRIMYEYLTVRDAAQEGAGYAAVFPNDCNHIVDRVMQNLPDNNYTVSIEVDGISCAAAVANDYAAGKTAPDHGCAGNTVKVTIDHTTDITMPLISAFTGTSIPMHVVLEDRIVRPACYAYP